ncbi:MAG: ABC transporter substrate-binding protein [Dehalococcoidia bacterium]|nr:ABC transporter substrate-binding protein [Dehalococcoidia bacterium]
MKRVVFLIIASLLVIGLVLPGCAPAEENVVKIAVCGPMTDIRGQNHLAGAEMARDEINAAGGVTINSTKYTIELVTVDTNEIIVPSGVTGVAALSAVIDDVDFVVGGFRTEAVAGYREVAMDAHKIFMNCGAATELLCHSVVTNYAHYKWFFKGTPMNEYLLAESQSKVLTLVIAMATAVKPAFVPRIAILAEDAQWTRAPREAALADFQAAGYSVGQGLWLVNPSAGIPAVAGVLGLIKAADPNTNIIYTIFSGPVGMTYADQVGINMPHVLSIGINVEAQRQDFGTEATYANGMIFMDGWAPGVNITVNTAAFVSAFVNKTGENPIYTAATYDAVYSLVEALQSEGYVDGSTVKYMPEDIVVYLQTATRQGVAAKKSGVYPIWDGTTTGTYYEYPGKSTAGLPALNESQVLALYPWLASAKFSNNVAVSNWTYTADNWTMQPHTTHDLVFGSEWAGGIASQWQWNGTALNKVCIWPQVLHGLPSDMTTWLAVLGSGAINATTLYRLQSFGLWDQYGWWNFEYQGTGSLNLTDWILSL